MEDHVYTLIQQTRANNPTLQKQSAVALGQIDLSNYRKEAIRALCGLLGHEHLDVREAAEQALIKIGGREVIEALIPLVASPSTTIVNYAIEILSKIGHAHIDLILRLLESKDHDVRKFGCDILGNLGCKDSVYDLVELLNDPHINVAIAAGEALGKIGDAEAVPYLIQALHHPDTWMKCIAAEALGRIGDPRAVDAFIGMATTEDPIVLYTVIKALGHIQDDRVLPYIISILRANSLFATSAVQAIESLAVHQGATVYEQVKTAGVTTCFIRLLSSDNIEVLRSVIRLVGKLQLKEAVQPLQKLLSYPQDDVVADVITALATIGERGSTVPALQARLAQTTNAALKNLLQHTLETLQKP
jgi:HEAT repeat protein